jgi:hypothetical protein
MKHFIKAFEAGKPIIGLRTSTHPFQFEENSPYFKYNKFGEDVFGEEWVSHWGKHKFEATRGVVDPAAKDNPILRGVTDVFGDTDVYEAHPQQDSVILMRGIVLSGMQPDSTPASYRKKRSDGAEQDVNDPAMPIAWTRQYKNNTGKTNRVFCTTMGAATDLKNEGLRRLVVNAIFWGLEVDVPKKADVAFVDSFEPTAYGFDGYKRGMRPADFEMKKQVGAASRAAQTGNAAREQQLAPERKDDKKVRLGSPDLQRRLPLKFAKGERIALVGNSLAERMNLYGNFETMLHARLPLHQLVVRNFARPCDAVDNRQRSSNYTAIDDPLQVFQADTFICFYGFNESFAGEAGEEQFRAAYNNYLDETAAQYRRANGEAPRFVLVTPIAFEPTGNPLWPDGAEHNARLNRYAAIVKEVARDRGLACVDLFAPTEPLFTAEPGMQFTINGCH